MPPRASRSAWALPVLDAVWICTPQSTHRAIAQSTLSNGVNVMCEKAIAAEHDDAVAMARLAEESESLLAIGNTLRIQNEFLELKRDVESGTLGQIVQVSAIRNVPDFEGRMLSGRTTPTVEIAVHDLDTMLWLCGDAPWNTHTFWPALPTAGPGQSALLTPWPHSPSIGQRQRAAALRVKDACSGSRSELQSNAGTAAMSSRV